ncbi:hypothetical protein RhiirC2_863927 [Rhizophagus irregularis]|uniref:Uncharacterized protein n=1 Tax=Rhizophagus irregularis TaxID=588596 RepID=A0A2N1NK86_9GLOM|nr:hypothetical protein RhiirC2_863927 [Rhizophagus irregularis]
MAIFKESDNLTNYYRHYNFSLKNTKKYPLSEEGNDAGNDKNYRYRYEKIRFFSNLLIQEQSIEILIINGFQKNFFADQYRCSRWIQRIWGFGMGWKGRTMSSSGFVLLLHLHNIQKQNPYLKVKIFCRTDNPSFKGLQVVLCFLNLFENEEFYPRTQTLKIDTKSDR